MASLQAEILFAGSPSLSPTRYCALPTLYQIFAASAVSAVWSALRSVATASSLRRWASS